METIQNPQSMNTITGITTVTGTTIVSHLDPYATSTPRLIIGQVNDKAFLKYGTQNG